MDLEHGDIKKPTGNAIIYWNIKGENPLVKQAKIIASNFVISPLQFNDETLMVNFPPILIENHDKLIEIVVAQNVDLIQGGEIFIPKEITDFNKFYRKQIDKYNDIIQEYLLAFKEQGKQKHTSNKNLPQLINEAGELMVNVRKLVKARGKRTLIDVKIEKLKEIEENLNNEMRGLDLGRILRYIEKPDREVDELVDLYTRKFFAIFLEDYEKADFLKQEIKKIEKSISG
jgi:hypothetical protein